MTPAQLSLIRRFTYPRCAHSEVWLLANARNIDKCDRRICRLWDVSGNEAAEDQSALLDFGVLSHGRGKGVKIPFEGKVIDEESGLRVFRAVPSEIVGDNAVYFAFGYCRPVLTVFQQYLEESTPAFQLYLSTAAATIDVAEETSPTVGNGRRRRASASGRDYLKDVDSVSEGDDDNLVPPISSRRSRDLLVRAARRTSSQHHGGTSPQEQPGTSPLRPPPPVTPLPLSRATSGSRSPTARWRSRGST